MRAIDVLIEEHRLLALALQCLDQLVCDLERGDDLDGSAAARLLEYFERFADGSHQDKEEQHLFPVLRTVAPVHITPMVRELRVVHTDERGLLDELRTLFEGAVYGEAWSLDSFAAHARDYADLQRRHSRTEDVYLFPLAEQYLGERDDAELLEWFRRIDASTRRAGRPDAVRLVEDLCEHLGLEEATLAGVTLQPSITLRSVLPALPSGPPLVLPTARPVLGVVPDDEAAAAYGWPRGFAGGNPTPPLHPQ